ncbi:MAG: methyltransferase family protein [Gemmatimonadetes bacterium]|jgi:2-polyprenyl-3-methyl-5-hydroxy-6-metoxy-1,4-benzoquinol methylase|nr:methyltransferase family protein [Gemmatimonadota bacterium]
MDEACEMDSEYGQRYRDLYFNHWWWRARERLILEKLRSIAPPEGFPTILDVGCGDGLFFDKLQEFGDVEGVETDDSIVDPSGKWASRIKVQPFDQSFEPGRRYSLITALDVIEHIPDAESALRLTTSLLEPNGVFLATVPAFQSLWTTHDDVNHHVQRFTTETFTRLTKAAGLETMSTQYFFFWTCPIKLMIGFKERVLHMPSGIAGVPSPFVNRACYNLSVLEHATLGRLPMPFGSSLMFIGRRKGR